jgi:hypothetical protein
VLCHIPILAELLICSRRHSFCFVPSCSADAMFSTFPPGPPTPPAPLTASAAAGEAGAPTAVYPRHAAAGGDGGRGGGMQRTALAARRWRLLASVEKTCAS